MKIDSYRPNRGGIVALLRAPATGDELMRKAQMVAAGARSRAPVGSPRGGHLKDKIIVERVMTKNRVAVRVVANTPYAKGLRSNYLVGSLGDAKLRVVGPKVLMLGPKPKPRPRKRKAAS